MHERKANGSTIPEEHRTRFGVLLRMGIAICPHHKHAMYISMWKIDIANYIHMLLSTCMAIFPPHVVSAFRHSAEILFFLLLARVGGAGLGTKSMQLGICRCTK